MYQWVKRLFQASEPAPAAPGAAQASQAPSATAGASAASAAGRTAAPATAALLSFEQRDGVNGTYFSWLFENAEVSGLDTTPHENQVLDALSAILASQQSGAALVRRLPGLLPQLLQSLRSDNFSGAQLSRTISNDVVLVAAVIRMANTSFKGSGTTISSVEHAVMLIGQEGLRHLITSVAFRPIIDLNSGQYTRLLAPRIWDQSERCAVANRMLAEQMGIDPFEAFLAGLVQNVGLIVTLRIMDQMSKGEKELGSEMFCARLVRDARILTCSIGREWNFPENVVTAIGEQAGMRKGVPVSPLGQLLTQSDYLSKVRILVENARLGQDDPVLFKGLSAQAMACYRTLDAIEDAPPAPSTPAAAAP
jgi:HD-like signal output (HDOD) protein